MCGCGEILKFKGVKKASVKIQYGERKKKEGVAEEETPPSQKKKGNFPPSFLEDAISILMGMGWTKKGAKKMGVKFMGDNVYDGGLESFILYAHKK